MCNLYSLTRAQDAMRQLFAIDDDLTGNLPPLPDIFPDQMAPVVRVADGRRRLEMMRWGMPGPPQLGATPLTNIRNPASPHWRRWLEPANRVLVPFTSFCEWADTRPRKTPTWFALDEDRPLCVFAGVWTAWQGTRGPKSAAVAGEHALYGFLTTTANAVVGRVHPKAMPVILTTREDYDTWLHAPWSEAKALQRPLPDDRLRIVATGEKADGAIEAAPPTVPAQLDLLG